MKRFLLIVALLALVVIPARADLTWNLNKINLDDVLSDARFSGLSGAGQAVAVIDTGVDTQHIGFQDGGTRVIAGYNFASDSPVNSPNYSDYQGHGTRTSGLVASSPLFFTSGGQSLELRGPAFGADVISLRALGRTGSGSFDGINNALQWVIDNRATYNITVVNMSLGTSETFLDPEDMYGDPLVDSMNGKIQALRLAGVAVVVASGNSYQHGALSFPAILPDTISVGSTGTTDALSSFSNASALLDLLAPGEGIWSTAFSSSSPTVHNLVGSGNGTSYSAPQVAGAVMLIRELFEQRVGRAPTVDEIESLLEDTGVPVTFDSGGGVMVTKPRMDLYAALDAAYAVPEPATVVLLILGSAGLLVRRRKAA